MIWGWAWLSGNSEREGLRQEQVPRVQGLARMSKRPKLSERSREEEEEEPGTGPVRESLIGPGRVFGFILCVVVLPGSGAACRLQKARDKVGGGKRRFMRNAGVPGAWRTPVPSPSPRFQIPARPEGLMEK